MGLLDRLRGGAKPETKADATTPQTLYVSPEAYQFLTQGNDDGDVKQGLMAFAALPILYACLQYRAEKLAELPLYLAKVGTKGERWVKDADLDRLFEEPNPDMDMGELLRISSYYEDLTGAVLWVKNRDRMKRLANLYPFSAESFTVRSDGIRLHSDFEVRTADGMRDLKAVDVVFRQRTNPANPFSGMSLVDAALTHLRIGKSLQRTVRMTLQNSMLPGGVLSTTGTLSEASFRQLEAQLQAKFSSPENAGKVLIVDNEMKYTPTHVQLKDLELGKLWREVEAAVCQVCKVPPLLVGAILGLENSPWSNAETARRYFYEETMLPLWKSWEGTITRQLVRERIEDRTIAVRFDKTQVAALQADRASNATIAAASQQVLRVDEWRALIGLEPVGGEEGQLFVTQFATHLNPPPPPPPVVVAPAAEETDPTEETERLDEEEKSRTGAEAKRRRYKPGQREQATLMRHGAHLDARASSLKPWVMAQLQADRDAILELAEKHIKKRKADAPGMDRKEVERFLAAAAKELSTNSVNRLHANLRGLIEDTAITATQSVAGALNLEWDVLNPHVLEWVDNRVEQLGTWMGTTTGEAVATATRMALEEGVGVDGLMSLLRSDPAFAGPRAELVARTETLAALNGGAHDSLAASDLKLKKRWLTAPDHRVRHAHAAMNGTAVDMDADFPNGVKYPSEPNCRCTLLYEEEPE